MASTLDFWMPIAIFHVLSDVGFFIDIFICSIRVKKMENLKSAPPDAPSKFVFPNSVPVILFSKKHGRTAVRNQASDLFQRLAPRPDFQTHFIRCPVHKVCIVFSWKSCPFGAAQTIGNNSGMESAELLSTEDTDKCWFDWGKIYYCRILRNGCPAGVCLFVIDRPRCTRGRRGRNWRKRRSIWTAASGCSMYCCFISAPLNIIIIEHENGSLRGI